VQLGRHVDDVRTALRWLERELGLERFVVGGLCGGALTGLLTAEKESGIVGLYSIGIPVVLDGGSAHVSANMTKGELSTWRGEALAKMLRPSAWLRVLTFRSDIRTILRSFFPQFGRGGGKKVTLTKVPAPAGPLAENLNPHFPRALFGLLQRKSPALLLFSGADRLQFEYQEKFATPWAEALREHEALLQVTVIPKANHVLGDAAWVDEARRITADWLDRCVK
jgi:pimeloyl-ACP methyl ester carboxylesterase